LSSITETELLADIRSVEKIDAVPMILDVICRTTGMGFAAVARVTENRWIAASVLDKIGFGLTVGGELEVKTTICDEIRDSGKLVAINHVAQSPEYQHHHTPKTYGLQSYISVPIYRRNDEFFGTLCAIDPNPAKVESVEIIDMFKLFAQLIGTHLDNQERMAFTEAALLNSQKAAELREQFIAILGHDLRNPLNAIAMGTRLLRTSESGEASNNTITRIERSVIRMFSLVDNMLDFSRARLGGGFVLNKSVDPLLRENLEQVIAELSAAWPDRNIQTSISLAVPVSCDSARICQLLSNLTANALTHGARDGVVSISIRADAGKFELVVQNQGTPIDPAIMRRLFQPFVRGADPKGKNSMGLGLGLFIASEIAKAHDGQLTVASDLNRTAFTFQFQIPPSRSGIA
jgi:signal transduction histidine kinase